MNMHDWTAAGIRLQSIYHSLQAARHYYISRAHVTTGVQINQQDNKTPLVYQLVTTRQYHINTGAVECFQLNKSLRSNYCNRSFN